MYPAERQAAIVASAQAGNGEISVALVSAQLNVTPETIRRDLAVLERQGLLSRKHGGAQLTRSAPFELALAQRQLSELPEKNRIATRVMQELPSDGVVLLDSGSLTLTIAQHFPDDRDLIVVTNNLAAVQVLAAKPRLTVLALPGRVRNLTQGAVDEWTRQRIATLNVDLAIIGGNGLTLEHGVTTTIPDEAEVKRAMLLSGRRRILALTSTKIGLASFCHVADVDELDMIVTDSGADSAQVDRLGAAGPDLVVV
ncbi:DeoR/GlpR family DNA-binding transcription regulator [Lysinibacter cavernae]|uniref:Lactose phosphotransferase system repressor n=1 Tax=Lysinibacter cavernae TaxID=1640652 RepID=A0A7X5R073_9MICO|nr:DeoR/GlpR family DNA-binding transcription regulator [Lysinibacter cavernae]NIH53158.1 DeoR family fructose operon transcriptional repressor [Lysinibacter cavernae]